MNATSKQDIMIFFDKPSKYTIRFDDYKSIYLEKDLQFQAILNQDSYINRQADTYFFDSFFTTF